MTCLIAIETSTEIGWVSAYAQNGSVAECCTSGMHSHSEQVAPLIAEACGAVSAAPSDVSCVLLGSGPGSFTGLRIGFSVGKGLAFANGCGIRTYDSLCAAAWGARRFGRLLVPLADARREQFFCAAYGLDEDTDRFICHETPQLVCGEGLDEWIGEIEERLQMSAAETLCLSLGFDMVPPSRRRVMSPDELTASVGLAHSVGLAQCIIELSLAEVYPKKLHQREFHTSKHSEWPGFLTGEDEESSERLWGAAASPALSLSRVQPLYVREVAARTIAEREKKRID